MSTDFDPLDELTDSQYEALAVRDSMRLLCLSACNGGSLHSAAATFVQQSPRSVHAVLLRKALASGELFEKSVAPATTTDLPNAGALLPPAHLAPLVRRLQQASVLSAISEPAPVNVPIPYETTAPSLAWVKEGSPKGVTLLALASVKLGLHKFSGISVHSRELAALTEGRAVDVITNRLVNASRRFLDRQLLDPAVAAVASTNPASLTNGVTPVAAGATLDDTIAALTAAFWTAYPDAIRPTFVMSPATASKVNAKDTHRDLRVGGGVLNGIPAVTTLGALTNVILLDASAIFAYDGGAEVDQSRHAAIQMEAAPTDPPTAATTVLDLWSHNLIGLRLDRWCSWAKVPNSVQYAVVA